jgi:S-layer protein
VTAAAQTLTLTSGIDSATGGAGNDTINAGLDSGGNQTLTSLDAIAGGAGTDTLNVVMKANATPASTAVENFVVSTSAAATLDMLGSTGVASITNQASTNTLTVSNITGDVALTLSSTDQGGTFNFDTAGALAAQTVNVSSVTGGTLTVGTTGAVTLNSQGAANTVTLSSSATSLSVTGSENLTLAGTTAQSTVDASGATGTFAMTSDGTKAVSITGSAGADTIAMTGTNTITDTVSLGAGNDKVTFAATLDDADIVDGGDGTDTIVGISADVRALTSAATTSNITNFETLQISDQLNGALDVSDVQEDGIATVNLAHASAAAGAIISGGHTITGEAGAFTVNIGKSLAGNDSTLGNTLTISDGVENATTTDSLTVNNTGVNSTDGKNIILTNNITSTGYENVTFNTGAGSGNAEQTMATFTVTADAATAATTLTLTGSNAVDITTAVSTNSTAGITVDGSGLTAQAAGTTTMDLDTVAAGTGATITIVGSGGDDIFGTSVAATHASLATTVNSGAGDDVIYTGTGADTVNGGAGKDTIDTGSGNDTIDGGAGDDAIYLDGTLTKDDSVDGGEGTDTLYLNNADATTVNAYSLGQVATLNAAISGIEKIHFGAASLTQDIDVGRVDNISIVEFAALAGASTISGLAATNEIILREDTGAALGLALADATGTADVLNITIKESDLLVAGTITANSIETVNIDGIDDVATDVATVNTMTLVSDKATSIVVTGSDGLNLTSTGATRVTNFDASAVAANDTGDTVANMKVTYTSANASASAVVTIKGGAGEDALTGNAGSDTISGGAAADTIVASAGNDTVSGDAGTDTLQFTKALLAANSDATNTSTFDGGAGTDIVLLSDGTATIVDADFDGFSNVETFTTSTGVNTITMAGKADAAGFTKLITNAGDDVLDISDAAFNNALTIDAAGGDDTITISTDVGQVVTINQDAGDSTAASGGTANASSNAIAANETLVFGNGVDKITGFTGGVDKIDFTNTGGAVTAVGETEDNLTEDTIFFLSGNLSGTTFTVKADGTGTSTLVFENEDTNANDNLDTVNNAIILVNFDSDDLTATTFV